ESMSGRLAREILKAGERAAKLTGQLLVFGRQQVTSTETVDLGSIVSGMTEMLARLLGPRVTLAASISPGPRPLIMGNSIQMEHVVLNLIVNARAALPSGGTVNVRVDVLETARTRESKVPIPLVRLTVTDNGVGIDARTREHIFDPFFTTKHPCKGTG